MSKNYKAAAEELVEGLPNLLSVEDTAHVLRCSRLTVRRYIRRGRLQAIRALPSEHSRLLIPRSALADMLAQSLREGMES